MNLSQNDLNSAPIAPEANSQTDPAGATALPPSAVPKQVYVPDADMLKPSWKEHAWEIAVGCGFVLILVAFAGSYLSHMPLPAKKAATPGSGQKGGAKPEESSTSGVPLIDVRQTAEPESGTGKLRSGDIAKTAQKQATEVVGSNLGSVAPFDKQQHWEPAPYPSGGDAGGSAASGNSEMTESKGERDAMDKPSLVFVRATVSSAVSAKDESRDLIDWGIGLAPGTRLRARLESAVSTAVQTPVVAVIEYNYEQDGQIVIPAGAKAFGRLEAADRTGYIGVHFDSLTMPDGSTVKMEAAATDLALRPIKGKVEGKHTGKNILVRSMAGVGEIAATLAGRNSINQPLSESDTLRERVSSNIAQASDEEVRKLAVTEQVVISVPAQTEIYVVLQRPARTPSAKQPEIQGSSIPETQKSSSIPELRQLLQLQRELNQSTSASSANE